MGPCVSKCKNIQARCNRQCSERKSGCDDGAEVVYGYDLFFCGYNKQCAERAKSKRNNSLAQCRTNYNNCLRGCNRDYGNCVFDCEYSK